MDDPRSDTPGGGFFRPFIPGQPDDSPAGPGGTFGDTVGRGEPPPDMITDQVAGLAPLAELPSITEFMYDEPQRPTPAQPARTTPGGGRVPPLPGFSPARGAPAIEPEADALSWTPATPQQPYSPTPPPQPAYAPTPPPHPAYAPTPAPQRAYAPAPQPQPAYGLTPPPQPRSPVPPPAPPAAGDWSTGEWQRYDWRSAASLAPDERARAAAAWADLDWEADTRSGLRQKSEAVAAALEGIARRVRSGELVVHGHPGMTEEAAAAAALAAILARRP